MTDRRYREATDQRGERNIAIVLSAGRGSRMHAGIPKQSMELCGKPVIAWPLGVFEAFDGVDDVILVSSPEDIDYCRSEIVGKYGFRKVRSIIPGGTERYLSVWEGLKEAARLIEKNYEASYIFIQDGARPLIDEPILNRCLSDVRHYHACVAGMPVKDTIKLADENGYALQTPDRRLLWQIQTPQVFSFSLVYGAYRKLIEDGITNVTDDAMVVELETSTRVKLTEGSYRNIKITTPEDLKMAECFFCYHSRPI